MWLVFFGIKSLGHMSSSLFSYYCVSPYHNCHQYLQVSCLPFNF